MQPYPCKELEHFFNSNLVHFPVQWQRQRLIAIFNAQRARPQQALVS